MISYHPLPHFLGLPPQSGNGSMAISCLGELTTDLRRSAIIPINAYALLLFCRLAYKEVSSSLYSNLHFLIFYRDLGTLLALRALTPHAIASLKNLAILLSLT